MTPKTIKRRPWMPKWAKWLTTDSQVVLWSRKPQYDSAHYAKWIATDAAATRLLWIRNVTRPPRDPATTLRRIAP